MTSQEYTGVIIRLTTAASDRQREAVEAMVRGLPGTDDISFENVRQARDRLRKRCGDRKNLADAFDTVAIDDIPASFRFRIKLDRAKGSDLDPTKPTDGVERMLFVPAEVV